ncbi:MAG: thioesterase superfamily protein [Osedax symbiont Rs2]|nr:MAG: thioesterase superfamily protein [Osedax symbiont Rs2]
MEQKPREQQLAEPLVMTMLMTPEMANFSGNVHGGSILKLLDQVAYACAAHYSHQYAVTLSVDQVKFKQPVKVGELVTFYAQVNYVGRSTMEVGIKAVAEDIHSKQSRHTNSCYFTMVAVGDDGRPVTIPELLLDNPVTKGRFVAAKLRRQLRKEHDATMQAIDLKWTEQLDILTEQEIEDALNAELQKGAN